MNKYRAWDRYREHMCLVDYIEWNVDGTIKSISLNYHGAYYLADRVDNIVLMQFTGILDRYGKEIYDKDIIDCSVDDGELAIVEWDNDRHMWVHSRGNKSWNFAFTGIKVKGNVYETPLLITQGGIYETPIEDLHYYEENW